MKITWPQVGALALVIFPVTLLIGLGREVNDLMQWLGIMVPTLFAGAAYNEARTAKHNTNGRMTDLIKAIRATGGQVPAGYEDVDTQAEGTEND